MEVNPTYDKEGRLGTVEAKVSKIVESLGEDVCYQFCNWAQANVELDKVDKPTIVYVLPPSGTLHFSWREVLDRPSSQIAFVSPTDFDFDGSENDGIIEAMKRLCIRFILALNKSGYFEEIEDDLPYQTLYDHLDQNVTGIVVSPILKEIAGVNLCDEPERLGNEDDQEDEPSYPNDDNPEDFGDE